MYYLAALAGEISRWCFTDRIVMNYLFLLKDGIEGWNCWRLSHAEVICDLAGEDLSHGYFFEGNFRRVNLKGANLQRACLIGADLRGVDLTGADLSGAYLSDADLRGANLSYANLTNANLDRANLQGANLLGAQIADVDIRQLSDSSVEPDSDVLARSPSRVHLAAEPAVLSKSQSGLATSGAVNAAPQRLTAAFRPSFLHQMALQLRSPTRKTPEAALLRQQTIRQSAAAIKSTRANHPTVEKTVKGRAERRLSGAWRQMSKPVATLLQASKNLYF